ncbi:DMT family transporter [Paenibacillus agilis]|uniref:DMT family transporter n=1 Tax=Paenibacillus agilis TaxID=3020863 RepID=A0A559J4K6_9BACL|nr:DMT family transporter [Paenibacillus agilis]TVX94746.1 DMT family transporter [Paenibacillus agilis]
MIIAMSIFGSVGFFSVQTGVPALELVFVRCICATIFLSLAWYVTGSYKSEQWKSKEVMQILFCGLFLVLNWVFLFKSFELTSITIGITIYHLAPVIVLLVGSIFFKEKLTMFAVLSVVTCFVGTVLIVGVDASISMTDLMSSGLLWAFLAAVCYALLMMLGKGVQEMSSYTVTFLQTALGIVILLPFVNFTEFYDLTAVNWFYIIATGIIHTGIVYLLFFDSLRELPTAVISALVFVDPAVAILLDIVITGFVPSVIQGAGIVLIFVGMVFAVKKPPTDHSLTEKA